MSTTTKQKERNALEKPTENRKLRAHLRFFAVLLFQCIHTVGMSSCAHTHTRTTDRFLTVVHCLLLANYCAKQFAFNLLVKCNLPNGFLLWHAKQKCMSLVCVSDFRRSIDLVFSYTFTRARAQGLSRAAQCLFANREFRTFSTHFDCGKEMYVCVCGFFFSSSLRFDGRKRTPQRLS